MTIESGGLRRHGDDPGLERQKIGETAAVERHRSHLAAGHHIAHLRADGFQLDLARALRHRQLLLLLGHRHGEVRLHGAVGVDDQAFAFLLMESLGLELQVIVPDRQTGEGIETLAVRHRLVLHPGRRVGDAQGNAGDDAAARIHHGSRNTSRGRRRRYHRKG